MRQADHPILPVILNRWSRRAMSGEAVSRTELMSLFEAARWAPSSYNSQPWRFVYALRGSPAWQVMYDALDALNKDWCVNAGALIIVLSRTRYELDNRPDPSFALNAGAAWENLALQGTSMGLAVRGMQDFDYDALSRAFSIPDLYAVQMMIAVGRPGRIEDLPERLVSRENPTPRKPVSELAFEDAFPWEGE